MDNKLITVTSPLLPNLDEFHELLQQIWDSKWITNNGSFHKQLEKELAEYLGVPYLSLFTNGTLPLLTALQALRITGEVITTPYSFVATTHSIWWMSIFVMSRRPDLKFAFMKRRSVFASSENRKRSLFFSMAPFASA